MELARMVRPKLTADGLVIQQHVFFFLKNVKTAGNTRRKHFIYLFIF